MEIDLATRVLELLRAQGATLATAESLTGGRLAAAVTAVPGASEVYRGGVVAYATEIKISVLGVPTELVETHGVVSEACALAMARGVRALTGASYAVATTGVAGPDPQDGHPPGTVHVAVVGLFGERAVELRLDGAREQVQRGTVTRALSELRAILTREEGALE